MRNGAITSWPACRLEERRALWMLRRETSKVQLVDSKNINVESLWGDVVSVVCVSASSTSGCRGGRPELGGRVYLWTPDWNLRSVNIKNSGRRAADSSARDTRKWRLSWTALVCLQPPAGH